jgi:dihydrofolate reductase
MKLAIIAALNRDRVIGRGGKLPWHIPADLKRFKQLTTGHTVLMGRKTYESIGRPLPGRRNVVISSRQLQGVEVYPTIPAALEALKDEPLVFVIGGAQIYAALLDRADLLYLTIVDKDVEGDVFFPPYEGLLGTRFKCVSREDHPGFSFLSYERQDPE